MSCDILSLEWNSNGRDIHIVEPVLCYMECEYNLKVIRDSIWYGEFKLLKYKPKMLVIANGVGASNNFNIVKLARKLGIIVVELVSEGTYAKPTSKEEAERNFWGWNKDKRLYSHLILFWSTAMREAYRGLIPDAVLDQVNISGASGFDRYKLLKFMGKEELLLKYNVSHYRKLIGIAGWGFDIFDTDDKIIKKGSLLHYTIEERESCLKIRNNVKDMYKTLIEKNPDILFILKYHPAIYDKKLSEFAGLSEYGNVVEIVNEENIDDIINASDLWICYESTTCIEAWLLGKQTIFAIPEIPFKRSNLYLGSVVAKNNEDLYNLVNSFYTEGSLPGFFDKEKERKKLMEQMIGNDDGLNYVRAGNRIYKTLIEVEMKDSLSIDKYVVYRYLRLTARFIIFFTPLKLLVYKKYKLIRESEKLYKGEERERLATMYREAVAMNKNK